MSPVLIKEGRVLLFDSSKTASFPQLDILVEGQHIAQVGPNLEARGAEIVDATDYIVTPGFVDAHRHVFQSQLRSTVSNHTLLEYCACLLQGRMIFLDEDDMYLSQLSGLAEAVHSGVTTVMDHSHAITTPGRARQCIKATVESGIRSIYCASPFTMPVSLNPLTLPDSTVQHAEQVAIIKSLAQEKPLGGSANDGRVRLGVGFDTMFYVPEDIARDVIAFAVDHDLAMTVHDVPRYNMPALDFLRGKGWPLPKTTLSHRCDPSQQDIQWAREHEVGIVTTPESEMSMSHGHPSAFDFQRAGARVGLGVDSPAICSGDLFVQMRLALHEKRVREHTTYHARGRLPDVVAARTDEVLYMATMGGAAATHMEHEIGSIEVGKRADLVLIGTTSPNMVACVDYSAALVTHCAASDVDSVMINGEWVKRHGRLLKVNWDDLKVKLRENRACLESRWQHVDWDKNKGDLKDLWHLRGVME